MAALGGNRIDVLKSDCEGAEYSILDHLPPVRDDRVRFVRGEYHGVAPSFMESGGTNSGRGCSPGGTMAISSSLESLDFPSAKPPSMLLDLPLTCVWPGGGRLNSLGKRLRGQIAPLLVHDCQIHLECAVDRIEPGLVWCGRCAATTPAIQPHAEATASAIEQPQNTNSDSAAGQKNSPGEMYFENAARSIQTAPLR